MRHGGDAQRRVDPIGGVDARGIDPCDAGSARQNVHPPGSNRAQRQPRARWTLHQRARQRQRGAVFVQVLRLKPRDHHLRVPGGAQALKVVAGQALALAQTPAGQGDGMRQHGIQRLGQGDRAEDHDAFRSSPTICARIETAISAGVLAPISRPTGPRIRAISASVIPVARSRATRLAWVREEPRHPR